MTTRTMFLCRAFGTLLVCMAGTSVPAAEGLPRFDGFAHLAQREFRLSLLTAPASFCRIDFSEDLFSWTALVTLASGASAVEVTDSSARESDARFYRAAQVLGTNVFTGDHLATSQGDAILHPVSHGSLALHWNGRTVFIDPANLTSQFSRLPRPDLVLLTHSHGDHYNAAALTALVSSNTVIIAPPSIQGGMPATLKTRTTPLANGGATNYLDIGIEAVPAYNLTSNFHPKGTGNGYVLTVGGKQIYISGDTEDIPEMRALENIDVAFVCMNLPYTMTVEKAVSAVREFRPKVVYPYHYSQESNATKFKELMAAEPAVEVRLRKWY